MTQKHYANVNQIPKPAPFVVSPVMHLFFLVLVVIGVAAFAWGLKENAARTWHSYLLNYFYWLTLSLSGLFFMALQYITSSMWSSPLKRIPESFISFLPLAFILMLFPFIGMFSEIFSFFSVSHAGHPSGGMSMLYEWTHSETVASDAILKGKESYLNLGFFLGRNVFSFLIWMGAGFWLVRNSLKQDVTGSVDLTRLNRKIAAPFLVLFALTYTVASFDWLMSLEPHWFSTVFGVYCFAGLFESGMALTILFVVALRRQGAFKDVINENHLHDLGKLMFAFCVFWAYIAFSQYMLIWYGNLPEEIGYMIRRTEGSWTPVALALLFGKFVVPFFLLISRSSKRSENYLLFVSVWVLAAQYLDVYWMIYPLLGSKPLFGWQEVGLFLGFLGLFVLSSCLFLQRVQPVALKDPRLLEGVNHHQ